MTGLPSTTLALLTFHSFATYTLHAALRIPCCFPDVWLSEAYEGILIHTLFKMPRLGQILLCLLTLLFTM